RGRDQREQRQIDGRRSDAEARRAAAVEAGREERAVERGKDAEAGDGERPGGEEVARRHTEQVAEQERLEPRRRGGGEREERAEAEERRDDDGDRHVARD